MTAAETGDVTDAMRDVQNRRSQAVVLIQLGVQACGKETTEVNWQHEGGYAKRSTCGKMKAKAYAPAQKIKKWATWYSTWLLNTLVIPLHTHANETGEMVEKRGSQSKAENLELESI